MVDTTLPRKFLRGGRALTSVLSRYHDIQVKMKEKYPGVVRVRDYYSMKQDLVEICDVSAYIGRIDA